MLNPDDFSRKTNFVDHVNFYGLLCQIWLRSRKEARPDLRYHTAIRMAKLWESLVRTFSCEVCTYVSIHY